MLRLALFKPILWLEMLAAVHLSVPSQRTQKPKKLLFIGAAAFYVFSSSPPETSFIEDHMCAYPHTYTPVYMCMCACFTYVNPFI